MRHIIQPIVMGFLVAALALMIVTEQARFERRVIGLTAVCQDGNLTTSPRSSGVCANHGGVKRWIERNAK